MSDRFNEEYNERLKDNEYFLRIRRLVYLNYILVNAPIKEEDLTPTNCIEVLEKIGGQGAIRIRIDVIAKNNPEVIK